MAGRRCAVPREFGYELVLKAHSDLIRSKFDALMLMVHWRMLRHSFLSIGDTEAIHYVPTEVLKNNLGWVGESPEGSVVYVNKYVYRDLIYTLTVEYTPPKFPTQGEVAAAASSVAPAPPHQDCLDIKLCSDSEVARYALDVDCCVSEDIVVDMEACSKKAKLLDTDLIQPILFARHQAEIGGFSSKPCGGTLSKPRYCPAMR